MKTKAIQMPEGGMATRRWLEARRAEGNLRLDRRGRPIVDGLRDADGLPVDGVPVVFSRHSVAQIEAAKEKRARRAARNARLARRTEDTP